MTTEPKQHAERPVLKAISSIMADVGAVEKKGKNEFHKYDYATAADVAFALQKRMADAGLIVIPHQREMKLLANETVLAIEFEFLVEHVSGDRLEDRPVFTGMASARNSKGGFDDKAANKCLTAATKYFLLNLFRIPTGDYPDADEEEDKAHPAPNGNGNGKRTPQQPATLPADKSAELADILIEETVRIKSGADLQAWAARRKPDVDSLDPADRDRVRDAYAAKLNYFKGQSEPPHDPETGELTENAA